MDLVVGAAIAPVDVAPHARRQQAVVERGVEIGTHRRRRFDLKRAQSLAPFAFGARTDGIEVGTPSFFFGGIEVGDRARFVDARERDADFERAG